jgi:hypothetical protein
MQLQREKEDNKRLCDMMGWKERTITTLLLSSNLLVLDTIHHCILCCGFVSAIALGIAPSNIAITGMASKIDLFMLIYSPLALPSSVCACTLSSQWLTS